MKTRAPRTDEWRRIEGDPRTRIEYGDLVSYKAAITKGRHSDDGITHTSVGFSYSLGRGVKKYMALTGVFADVIADGLPLPPANLIRWLQQ